jgi:hypothetical protein
VVHVLPPLAPAGAWGANSAGWAGCTALTG